MASDGGHAARGAERRHGWAWRRDASVARIVPDGGGLVARLHAPVSIASLVAVRVAFGTLMLIAIARYFTHGWITDLFVTPRYFFSYEGLGWMRPWPGAGMYVHFAVLGALALSIAVGWRYRVSMTLFCLGFTYAHLIDKANYLNHYHLVTMVSLLMVFLPLDRAGSLDARRRPALAATTVPAWTVWALRAQLALVYVFGGLAKVNADWLLHAQPLRLWLASSVDVPLLGRVAEQAWVALLFSWGGLLFDLSIVPLLLWPRSRPWAYAAVVAFHLTTSVLFPIGMFPWIMMALTTVFFEPDWPLGLARTLHTRAARGALARRTDAARSSAWRPRPGDAAAPLVSPRPAGVGAAASPRAAARPPMNAIVAFLLPLPGGGGGKDGGTMDACAAGIPRASAWGARARVVVLALWLAVQVLAPLRFLAYPGDTRWREEGFRFAWKVMVMEKAGLARFRVTDPASSATLDVDPRDYLTPLQARMMATQPDMILAFAHELAVRLRPPGGPLPAVRVDAYASLNGRPSRRLVDPDVDLARARASLSPQPWILPLDEPAPSISEPRGSASTGAPASPRRRTPPGRG